MKRFIMTSVAAVFLLGVNGCVSIHDPNVNVQRPSDFDHYQRNILDKCKPHGLPHRLIHATMGAASTILVGQGVDVHSQDFFDEIWNQITPELPPGGTAGESLRPVVRWETHTVRFLPVFLSNDCEKVKPLGLESDCYQISMVLYKYVEGTNCGPRSSYPVFIYIYPKTPLPLVLEWSRTPERERPAGP